MSRGQHGEATMAQREITGRHVLLGMIAFFGVILAVNGVFLYTSLSTHTGVVANEPYRKGLTYNERIEADRVQQALGWSEDITLAKSGDALEIAINGRNGNPVGGLGFEGRIGRPATAAMDIVLEVKELAPGRYRAVFPTLAPGTWQVDLAAKELTGSGDKIVWRSRKRVRWQTPSAAQ